VTRVLPVFLGIVLLSSPALAVIRVLTPNDVTITEQGPCVVIRVAFPFPVTYLKHFPPTSGKEVRIQFEAFPVTPEDREALFTRRSFTPPRSALASLAELSYEGNVRGRPFLTLCFTRPRMFRVEQGKDFRSLVIVVRGDQATGECPPVGPTAAAEQAPGPSPPPTVVPPIPPPTPAPPVPPPTAVPPGKPAPPPISRERLVQLMDEAAKAMTRRDYRLAAELYTRVLEYPPHEFTQEARELLGLARERNGQLAEAQIEYETYLKLYPQGEEADRVRQRLAALLTARATPSEQLREAKALPPHTEIHGLFSQFYYRFDNFPDVTQRPIRQSLLATDLDFTLRRRSAEADLSLVFSGGYDRKFAEGIDDFRLNRSYFDALDREHGLSARVGRQIRSTDGVLGRFDGTVLSYQIIQPVKVNALFGFPEDQLLERYQTHTHFYGLSLDLGTFADRWNFNVYAIRQEAWGILDREAVGAEARYVDGVRSLFGLVDYDVSYNELNALLAAAGWIFPNRTTVNITFDQRKSPALTTTNALIGQAEHSLPALLRTRSEDNVRTLAEDRTAVSRSLTVAGTHPLSERFQLGADLTVSETTTTKASAGVDAIPATGYQYFVNTQLIGSSLMTVGDITIFGLRYSYTGIVETIGVNLNMLYPITRGWRINPKLELDYRRRPREHKDEVVLRPSLATDYLLTPHTRLELDGGVEWTPIWPTLVSNNTESMNFYVTVGYRVDF